MSPFLYVACWFKFRLPRTTYDDRSIIKENELIIAMLYFVVPTWSCPLGHWIKHNLFSVLKWFVELNSFPLQVPKYLSQQWEKATGRGEVGRLRICKYVKATAIKLTVRVIKSRRDTVHRMSSHTDWLSGLLWLTQLGIHEGQFLVTG